MRNKLFILGLSYSLAMISAVEAKTSSDSKGSPKNKPASLDGVAMKHLQKKKSSPIKALKEMSAEHPFMQALTQAYTTNPELKAKVKEQNAIAEELAKAYSGWRPKLNGSASVGYHKVTNEVTRRDFEQITGKSATSLIPKSAGVELRQNIFEGGKTLANTSVAENQILSGNADFVSTEQNVLLKAIQAYLNLWARRQELEITRTSVRFFEFNVEQAKARADVGEIGLTEIAEAEFRYDEALADFVSAEAEVQNAIAEYVNIIGVQPPKELILPADIGERVTLPLTMEDLKNASIKENPALQKAMFDAKVADAAIDVSTADLMPKVDVVGNTSRSLGASYRGSRVNDVSATLSVTVPIYGQGGADWAAVRASHQTAAQRAIDVKRARNQIIENAIKVWEARHASKRRVIKLDAQIKAGEVRIEGTRQESLVGERTLLDVLNAQRDVVGARINYVRAQRESLASGYEMLAIMGQLSTVLLGMPVQKYDVKGYAEEASGRYIGWGDVPSREEIRNGSDSSR